MARFIRILFTKRSIAVHCITYDMETEEEESARPTLSRHFAIVSLSRPRLEAPKVEEANSLRVADNN
jgi:hypothetical protein